MSSGGLGEYVRSLWYNRKDGEAEKLDLRGGGVEVPRMLGGEMGVQIQKVI
jgi:hypothetical protein